MKIEVGSICECSRGLIGIVIQEKFNNGRGIFFGINLDTGRPWQSINPGLLAPRGHLGTLIVDRLANNEALI